MSRKHSIIAFILVSLNLIDLALGFAAYESKDTALINNLRGLVKMAAKEQVQAAKREKHTMSADEPGTEKNTGSICS